MYKTPIKWKDYQLDFIKESIELGLTGKELEQAFWEHDGESFSGESTDTDYRGRTKLYRAIDALVTKINNWPFYLQDWPTLKKRILGVDRYAYGRWSQEETELCLNYLKTSKNKSLAPAILKNIILEIFEKTGKVRSDQSVKSKLNKLRTSHSLLSRPAYNSINMNIYPIHSTLKLDSNQVFDKGVSFKYKLTCEKGHKIEKFPGDWCKGCGTCKSQFVGGIPKNDYRPGLVYLIYIKELSAIKIGYASGVGEEAIAKRFEAWEIPWEYEILAYDQSTRSEAGEHEQFLLESTIEHKYFTEPQDFAGWTEFRHISIFEQLLPEYETIFDAVFNI